MGFPHDLLKLFYWKKHSDPHILPEDVRRALSMYTTEYVQFDGRKGQLTLEQVIEKHHSTEHYWERVWHEADRLSAALARLRYEYDYWYEVQADPFFLRVYKDIVVWDEGMRRQLCNWVFKMLLDHAAIKERHEEALRQVNDLLRYFPSDSMFPLVSLRTHHILTDMLRSNPFFLEKCKDVKPIFDSLYLLKVSIDEPEFHKLKERREFLGLRSKALGSAQSKLAEQRPLRIGDDLYVVLFSWQQVEGAIVSLQGLGFGFRVEVFEWNLKKTEHGLYVVEELKRSEYGLGGEERWEHRLEGIAIWARILDDPRYDYVAWVSIRPLGDMGELAEQFLRYAESELARKYGSTRRQLEGPLFQKVSLSPELLLSIAEGYNDFLRDCAGVVNPQNPVFAFVVKSFNGSVLLRGLRTPSEALGLYLRLSEIKKSLHIPALLSLVVAEPKYPFWRVIELFSHKADNITFVTGEKMVKLEDKHAKMIQGVLIDVRRIKKGQFHKLVNAACRDDKEILKIKINAMASDRKLDVKAARRLSHLVDEIASQYRDDDERKQVTCEIFKILRMFTGGQ